MDPFTGPQPVGYRRSLRKYPDICLIAAARARRLPALLRSSYTADCVVQVAVHQHLQPADERPIIPDRPSCAAAVPRSNRSGWRIRQAPPPPDVPRRRRIAPFRPSISPSYDRRGVSVGVERHSAPGKSALCLRCLPTVFSQAGQQRVRGMLHALSGGIGNEC